MDIGQYLSEHGVPFVKHQHRPAYTAQEVAAEEHVSGKRLAKPVLVAADDSFAMCVLPAHCKLDMDKAAAALGVTQIRLADEAELAKVFPDVEVGAEPPFGSLYDLPTLVDEHLASQDEIVFQAGSHACSIRMSYQDYASLVRPQTNDLAVHA